MTTFLKKYWIIIAILILASFLRFWKLDSYPALNADEAAIGYNAYSLLKTGLDEHGHPWPIHFQSFNDYKPGLYFYIVMPFVKFIGLNAWAVRIPNAAIGVLSVLAVYLLVLEFFKNEKLAVISAFFLAISPWAIQFSRGGWEVNTSTFFIMLGILFFVKSVKNKNNLWKMLVSILFFVLSLYTYHAARVVAPLLAIWLLIIYRKSIFNGRNTKLLIISSLAFVLLVAPLAHDLFSTDALARAEGVGLFADPGPINRINEQRGEYSNPNGIIPKLLHNKIVNYGLDFAENWTSHYHGLSLFLSGDGIQRDQVPETGQMYLFDILFLAVGFITIIREYESHKEGYSLIIFWLIVAPIASALTFQAPDAVRSQNMVIPLIIISAIGFVSIIKWLSIRAKWIKIGGLLILGIFVIWNFARYEHMYWVHMAKEYPFSSQYGVKELVSYVEANESKYDHIVVTDKYDQPYVLFLFYMKYPPQEFQGGHVLTPRDQFGFSTVRDFGKFHFGITDIDQMKSQYPHSLIIVAPSELHDGENVVKKIYGSNGYEYFDIIAN